MVCRFSNLFPYLRGAVLRVAHQLAIDTESLAMRITEEVGKPIMQTRAEVRRTRDILRDVAGRADELREVTTPITPCGLLLSPARCDRGGVAME
jgi:acyl-CoA reductase-like NAD-dependent aldehyde dehydrogenase